MDRRAHYQKNREKILVKQRETRRKSREHYRLVNKAWKDRNREKLFCYQKNRDLKRRFGISLEDYQTMLNRQEGRCACCLRLPGKLKLAVDHNHETGKVRALICVKCNVQVAVLENRIVRKRAMEYLKKFDGEWVKEEKW